MQITRARAWTYISIDETGLLLRMSTNSGHALIDVGLLSPEKNTYCYLCDVCNFLLNSYLNPLMCLIKRLCIIMHSTMAHFVLYLYLGGGHFPRKYVNSF